MSTSHPCQKEFSCLLCKNLKYLTKIPPPKPKFRNKTKANRYPKSIKKPILVQPNIECKWPATVGVIEVPIPAVFQLIAFFVVTEKEAIKIKDNIPKIASSKYLKKIMPDVYFQLLCNSWVGYFLGEGWKAIKQKQIDTSKVYFSSNNYYSNLFALGRFSSLS